MNILFYISIMIFVGLLSGKVAGKLKLPNVTGYLIGGLLVGPYIFKIIPENIVVELEIISQMALGFIAFTIGSEFKISYFKRVKLTPIVIAIFEGLAAFFCVSIGLLIFTDSSLELALILGAISSATAPAATIMVIKQYNAKGPVTETLMSVVALDDAVCLISFGFASSIVRMLSNTSGEFNVLSLLMPLLEISGSILLGGFLGIIFSAVLLKFKQIGNRLAIIIGFIFLGVSVAKYLNLSDLLLCMSMGAIFINTSSYTEDILDITDSVTPPLYMLFFIVSGAELNISVLSTIGLVGSVYVVFRVIGKITGAYIGAKIMKAPDNISKYLGLTLIPQAGVAIGLSLMARDILPEYSNQIRAVVLCATFIYEMVGPLISKMGLQMACEIEKVQAK